jgi:hypothetical protein
MNGYGAEGQVPVLAEAGEWLIATAVRCYSKSVFGQKYRKFSHSHSRPSCGRSCEVLEKLDPKPKPEPPAPRKPHVPNMVVNKKRAVCRRT